MEFDYLGFPNVLVAIVSDGSLGFLSIKALVYSIK
jgi:hypothetical protein